MTAKNIQRASIEGDKYYTPYWCAKQFLKFGLPKLLDGFVPKTILEPCAGGGVFVDLFRSAYPKSLIVAVDIDRTNYPWRNANKSINQDFLTLPQSFFDLIVTNPPFTYALDFCEKAVLTAPYVAMLVRQGFLASQRRYKFFKQCKPSHVFLITSRPSFVYGATDTADYCWVCWRSDSDTKVTKLRWLPPVKNKETRK
jgi:hypothetical protein